MDNKEINTIEDIINELLLYKNNKIEDMKFLKANNIENDTKIFQIRLEIKLNG